MDSPIQQPMQSPQPPFPQPTVPEPKKLNYNPILIIIAVIIGATLLIGGFVFVSINKEQEEQKAATQNEQVATQSDQIAEQQQNVTWEFDGNAWKSNGTPPPCPAQFLITTPVVLNRVESVLYPGQTRGDDYKPHGGFRLKGANAVEVMMPLDAVLVSGSRYIEQGETQYLLNFVHPCGIAFRFDHLQSLTLEVQKAVDTLPPAQPDDSRTTKFETPLRLKEGQNIATAVGFTNPVNVSFDFGMYDYRQQNEVSKNPEYAQLHQNDKEQAFYAVCWLDYLLANDTYTLESLPGADAAAGSKSDYCK